MTSSDVQATFCATLLDEWVRAGVRNAVVCPGSRSTPMALAIAECEALALHVVLDERSGSFFALGLGRATGQPTVLLCTSGTAAVEFHPAVVEAHLDRVPMIVITADRPPELHGIGAPQTVDQQHLYGRSVRSYVEPGVADAASSPSWRSVGSRAYLAAAGSVFQAPGPVHLNLAFREPLVGKAGRLPAGRAGNVPWHQRNLAPDRVGALGEPQLGALAQQISKRNGVIVAGANSGDAPSLHALAKALQWPILADPRSGARFDAEGVVVVAHPDAFLRSSRVAETLRPQVVIRFGAPWASKVVNQWLSTIDYDILVDPSAAWLDPNRAAAVSVAMDPTVFCANLAPAVVPAESSWSQQWHDVESSVRRAFSNALDDEDKAVSEPQIIRTLMKIVPAATQLVVSSSMPIRDLEWFSQARDCVVVHANRGANGIDGVVSTALGVAAADHVSTVGLKGPTVGLLGDLAFLHDAGALVLAAQQRSPCVFVVIDNGGGGIFEFLPQATSVDRKRFEVLYGTPQAVDIVKLCKAHGLDTSLPTTARALSVALTKAVKSARVSVIVMRTDRRANVEIHDQLNAAAVTAAETSLFRGQS
jgi:2-succinyl-5-enolpyruvyl-6-hydroxy-3-cyclohexene-1-carboxylate synthase